MSITFTRKSQKDESARVLELLCRREKRVGEGFRLDHTLASPEEMSGGRVEAEPGRDGPTHARLSRPIILNLHRLLRLFAQDRCVLDRGHFK